MVWLQPAQATMLLGNDALSAPKLGATVSDMWTVAIKYLIACNKCRIFAYFGKRPVVHPAMYCVQFVFSKPSSNQTPFCESRVHLVNSSPVLKPLPNTECVRGKFPPEFQGEACLDFLEWVCTSLPTCQGLNFAAHISHTRIPTQENLHFSSKWTYILRTF